jgi:regulator of nonsense transcripts 2
MLEKISSTDTEQHEFITVIVSFCKFCGLEVAGLTSRKLKQCAAEVELNIEVASVFGEEVEGRVRKAMQAYYDALATRLIKDHKKWQRMLRKNELAMELKGELHEEKQKEQDETSKKYEKLLTNTTTLSDLLDLPMPDLPEEEPDELLSSMNIDMSNPFKDMEGKTSHLWEDKETQEFYENCTDLRIHVPEMLYVPGARFVAELLRPRSSLDVCLLLGIKPARWG